MKDARTRVTITVGNGLLSRIDEYCDRTGLTRSGFIQFVCAQQLDNIERANNAVAAMGEQFLQQLPNLVDSKR